MDRATIDKIFETFNQLNANPQTELKFTNVYTCLVAVILSARTTDAQVNKATESLFKIINTPSDMLKLEEAGLKECIKSIGLYITKARNIMAMSKLLLEKYNSKVPSKFEDLISLPGVGSKTAKVILNAAFHEPVIAVDTHVFRVSRRLGLTNKTTVPDVAKDLDKVIPDKWKIHAHHWLVLHGRYICKARRPLCPKCPVSKYCKYFKNHYLVLGY